MRARLFASPDPILNAGTSISFKKFAASLENGVEIYISPSFSVYFFNSISSFLLSELLLITSYIDLSALGGIINLPHLSSHHQQNVFDA